MVRFGISFALLSMSLLSADTFPLYVAYASPALPSVTLSGWESYCSSCMPKLSFGGDLFGIRYTQPVTYTFGPFSQPAGTTLVSAQFTARGIPTYFPAKLTYSVTPTCQLPCSYSPAQLFDGVNPLSAGAELINPNQFTAAQMLAMAQAAIDSNSTLSFTFSWWYGFDTPNDEGTLCCGVNSITTYTGTVTMPFDQGLGLQLRFRTAPVPEPATRWLVALFAGLGFWSLKRSPAISRAKDK